MSASDGEEQWADGEEQWADAVDAADAADGGGGGEEDHSSGRDLEYFGWVYHLGVNSVGHEYCHRRFLHLRGTIVSMYRRDPHQHPGLKPIRRGIIGQTMAVEELGRKKIDSGELYVLRFYNRLDETKKGEIGCRTAGEMRRWMDAFEHAKEMTLNELSAAAGRGQLSSSDGELNLEGHRRRVRSGLKRLIRIGKGPEMVGNKTFNVRSAIHANTYIGMHGQDAIEAHDWRCIRTVNGIRIFEDVANSKSSKTYLLKAVGVIDASLDAAFEVFLSLDSQKRHEWDVLTGELELVDSVDGHYDVVYGTYEPKNLSWWHSKKDFVFSRQWFHGQDGTYTILQFPEAHRKRPPRSGYHRIKVNPSVWEIRKLDTSESSSKCLVTHMLEVNASVWNRFRADICSKFEKTISYALLCQVAGLKAYFGANPSLASDSPSTTSHSNNSDAPIDDSDFEDCDAADEFYDALAKVGSFDDEDTDDDDSEDEPQPTEGRKLKLRNVSWAIAGLVLSLRAEKVENNELDMHYPPIGIDPDQFHGSLRKGESDTNCWMAPTGNGFMIRGKNYLKDGSKVMGEDPLLKLLAVDFLKAEKNMDNVALRPNCLVQSEAGKRLPFILVLNLEIPAKPNYSLVVYFGAERPVTKVSLLSKFIDGTDMFRDSRFKLIPSIVEGYWMVKRAVGTKACLLGKAVTCRYLRRDNFLEIDVDVGSSSIARSIIGLVLGYATGLVVDLAILIEAKEEKELPEYILGSVRLNRLKLDSAVPF